METIQLDQLKALNFTKQVAFAYIICERLYPNYLYFSENYNFGNPGVIRNAINFIFSHLFEPILDEKELKNIERKIYVNTPNPGDFQTVLASSALDCCTAVLEALNFLTDKKNHRIKDISTFSTDTVHMYIQNSEKLDFNTDLNFEQKIQTHPMMKRELAVQSGIISELINSGTFNSEDMQSLIYKYAASGRGNLDL